MAKLLYKNGIVSVILRVFLQDSSVSTGAGKTGLTSASAGLIISTIADNEATPTTYTSAGSTTETITTLGTFAAPTATKCRFKEVDATNFPGVYEIQIADARWSVSSARSLVVSVQATGVAQRYAEVQLAAVDVQDSVRFGLTALPNAAAESAGGMFTRGTGAGQINQLANGMVDTNVVRNAGTAITSAAGVQEVKVASIASAAITAASIASDAITDAKVASDVTIASVTGAVGSVTGAVGSVASGGISAASFVAGAIDATAIAADAIGASELAASAVTEIQAGLSTLDAAGVRTAVGLASANLDTQIATIQADTDNIQTRIPTTLVSGRIDASIGAMATDTLTSGALAASAVTEIQTGLSTLDAAAVAAATQTGLTAQGYTTTRSSYLDTLNGLVAAIWAALTSGLTTVGSVGKLIVDNINATISSRSSHSASDVWASATRLLTAGTNIVLAKGVGVTGLNDLDAAGIRTAVGLATANLDTQLSAIASYIDTEVAAIKAKTDNLPAAPAAVGDIPTAAQNAAGLLDLAAGVETGLTPRQAMRLMVAAMAGKLSGAATTTVVIRNAIADNKNRITATVDADGNRSAITVDLT